jgi:hypothetical protein
VALFLVRHAVGRQCAQDADSVHTMNNTEETTEAQKLAPYASDIILNNRKRGSDLIDGDIIVLPNGGALFEVFGQIGWLTRPGVCSYYSGRSLDRFGSWQQHPDLIRRIVYLRDTDVCQVYRRVRD